MKLIPCNNGEMYILTPTELKYIRHKGAPPDKVYDISSLGPIPRIIHQTWVTKQLPADMQAAVDALKAANPGWEHRLYNDEFARRFIIKHFDSHVTWAYDTLIPGTYKADLFRYCVMYVHGGVYLDIKYAPVDGFSFESWLPNETFVLEFGPFVYQGCFMCPPKHPRLKAAIECVVKNVRLGYYGDCHVCTTGPHMFGRLFTHAERMGMTYGYRNNGIEIYDRKTGAVVMRQYDGYRTHQADTYAKAGTKYWSTMWRERSIFDIDNFKSKHCPSAVEGYDHKLTLEMCDIINRSIYKKKRYHSDKIKYEFRDDEIIRVNTTHDDMIPKILYMYWNTDIMPSKMTVNLSHIKELHPDFTINIYNSTTAREFISTHFSEEVLLAYDTLIPHAYKSDLWRYCALYLTGGIYVDVKFELVNGFTFNDVKNEVFVKDRPEYFPNGNGIQNTFMATRPCNAYLMQAIKEIITNCHEQYYGPASISQTGPELLSRIFPLGFDCNARFSKEGVDSFNEEVEHIYLHETLIMKKYEGYRSECSDTMQTNYHLCFAQRNVYNPPEQYNMIPWVIHQTWGTHDLPDKMKCAINKLLDANPGWRHKLYDNTECVEFIANNYPPDVLWAFNTLIPGAFKADLFRYCLLYKYGGAYIDSKYEPIDGFSLSSICDKEQFVLEKVDSCLAIKSDDSYPIHLYQGFFLCKPLNQKIRNAIYKTVEYVKQQYYGECFVSPTGPHMFGTFFSKSECDNISLSYDEVGGLGEIRNSNSKLLLRHYSGYREDQSYHHKQKQTGYWKNMWRDRCIYDLSKYPCPY
jgi:mannosyltransferase OCH1-like enzyme